MSIDKIKLRLGVDGMDRGWIKSSHRMPEYNVSVLVFIPQEDNHITVGMWDISKKWVLLDEYRIPQSQVTYWRPVPEEPEDTEYTPCDFVDRTMSEQIRDLQKQNFEIAAERDYYKELATIADKTIQLMSPFVIGVSGNRTEAQKSELEYLDFKSKQP